MQRNTLPTFKGKIFYVTSMFHYSLDIPRESIIFREIIDVMTTVGKNIKVLPVSFDLEDGNLAFTIINLSGSDLSRIGVEMMLSNAGQIVRRAVMHEGPVFMGRTEIRPFDEDEYDDLMERIMAAEAEPCRQEAFPGRDSVVAGI